jgi:hypothetical protein
MHVGPEVVDHHLGTACGQSQSVLFAQTATGAGNDGHPPFEIKTHDVVIFPKIKTAPDAEVPAMQGMDTQL